VPHLLQRHSPHRTAHAALITEILGLLGRGGRVPPPAGQRSLAEPLSDSETRVLRYLPTNLTEPEIARELSVSPHTVKSHMRNLYAKPGTHRRTEVVDFARALGLLAPAAVRRQ
jgi:LuxR family maltose regulon positive regulatory protein